jgi:hypothetical protein
MTVDPEAWATFTGALVIIGVVLILAGVALAFARSPGLRASDSGVAAWRKLSLRRTLGIAVVGLGIVFALWGLAVVPF